jgi:hypothetical protein
MFRNLLKRKRVLVVLSVAMLAVAGAAFAYFTSTGTGTGNATVGAPSTYTVTTAAPTGGLLYPGEGTDTVTYEVKNNSTGHPNLEETTAALTTDVGGGVYDTTSKAFVDTCKASWFTVVNSSPGVPVDLAGGTSYTKGSATIALKNEPVNQNACQSLTPQLTVDAK